jgi:hypothetical protein
MINLIVVAVIMLFLIWALEKYVQSLHPIYDIDPERTWVYERKGRHVKSYEWGCKTTKRKVAYGYTYTKGGGLRKAKRKLKKLNGK